MYADEIKRQPGLVVRSLLRVAGRPVAGEAVARWLVVRAAFPKNSVSQNYCILGETPTLDAAPVSPPRTPV